MNNDERRRYFRIDDSMGVAWRELGSEEAKAFSEQARRSGGGIDFAANFDNRIQTLLESCRIQSPVAAELIDLLNKKLNFVIQQSNIDAELMQKVAYTQRLVNVSACGMAFVCEQSLPVGRQLQLDIVLQPGEYHIVAMAEVVGCDIAPAEGDGVDAIADQYYLRMNFLEIASSDQELLIQHIVQQQSQQLKRRRQQQLSE